MNTIANSRGPHQRCPWTLEDPKQVRVATRLDAVKGTAGGDRGSNKAAQKRYLDSKKNCDHDAARELVDAFVTDDFMDAIIDELMPHLEMSKRIILVHPQPKFNGDDTKSEPVPITNAIPFAFSTRVSEELGGEVNDEIVQIHRPGRTKLKKIQRLLYQPCFSGDVDPEAVYVLIDDAYTLGGTLAMLRAHIVNSGGTIGGVYVLCNGSGADIRFPLDFGRLDVLKSKYSAEFGRFWLKEIGHEIEELTDSEGIFLSEWPGNSSDAPMLEQLRDRFAAARAKGE